MKDATVLRCRKCSQVFEFPDKAMPTQSYYERMTRLYPKAEEPEQQIAHRAGNT